MFINLPVAGFHLSLLSVGHSNLILFPSQYFMFIIIYCFLIVNILSSYLSRTRLLNSTYLVYHSYEDKIRKEWYNEISYRSSHPYFSKRSCLFNLNGNARYASDIGMSTWYHRSWSSYA